MIHQASTDGHARLALVSTGLRPARTYGDAAEPEPLRWDLRERGRRRDRANRQAHAGDLGSKGARSRVALVRLWIANTGEWLDALLANAVDGCVWPERGYVYDAIAGSVRESPHKRSHDDPVHAADREMRCIADVVHLAKDGGLYVDDYKTGRPENIDHAAESWQLRALGLAAARFHGRDRVRVRMIHVDDAGRCRVHSEDLIEPWDLEEIAIALRDLALRIPTAKPTPGTWCRRSTSGGSDGDSGLQRQKIHPSRIVTVAVASQVTLA